MNTRLQAISFDVGGTLITPWPSVGQVYCDVAREHGVSGLDPEEVTARFYTAWGQKKEFDYSKPAWRLLVEQSLGSRLNKVLLDALFESVYQKFVQREAWHIYDDVLPALHLARSMKFKLAVLSNWDERLRPMLHNLGLAPFFDVIICSGEVNSHKPERGIFDLCAAQLGCAPDKILHIGDSPCEDVTGARNAGFQSALLDRKKSGTDLRRLIEGAAQQINPLEQI